MASEDLTPEEERELAELQAAENNSLSPEEEAELSQRLAVEEKSNPGFMDQGIPYALGITPRDITRGGVTSAFATQGALLGAEIGAFPALSVPSGGLSIPVLAGVGALGGGFLGDLGTNKGIDIVTGTGGAVPTGDDLVESGTASALNVAIPFLGGRALNYIKNPSTSTPLASNVLAGVDRINAAIGGAADKLLVGKNKLLRAFSPNAKDFNLTVRGRTVEDTIDEAFERGVFNDVTDSKDLYNKILYHVGSKTQPGVTGQALEAIAGRLDELPNSKIKFSELKKFFDEGSPDEGVIGFNQFKQKYLDPNTGQPLTEEGKGIISGYEKTLSQIKEAITAPYREELVTLRSGYNSLKSKPTANLTALDNEYLPKILELEKKISDPDVSFLSRYQAQKALDSQVASAFLKEPKKLGEDTAADMFLANAFRSNVKRQAGVIDPNLGTEFNQLKSDFELYKDLQPFALKAMSASARSALPQELGPLNQIAFKPIPGTSSIPGVGRIPIPTKIQRAPTSRELFEQGVSEVNRYRGLFPNLNPEPVHVGTVDRAARLLTATAAIGAAKADEAQAVSFSPKIDRPSLTKIDDTKNVVKDFVIMGLLTQRGISAENLAGGVPMGMFNELSAQADSQVQEMFIPIDEAIQRYGVDSNQAQVALSSVVASVPGAFKKSKSGILGEISVGNKRYLPLPEQRAAYGDLLRKKYRSNKTTISDVSRAMSKLNSDGEVVVSDDE